MYLLWTRNWDTLEPCVQFHDICNIRSLERKKNKSKKHEENFSVVINWIIYLQGWDLTDVKMDPLV